MPTLTEKQIDLVIVAWALSASTRFQPALVERYLERERGRMRARLEELVPRLESTLNNRLSASSNRQMSTTIDDRTAAAAKHLSPEHIESIIRVARIYPEYATGRVACPHCGAAKGELCISSSVPRLHSQRVDAAKDVMRKELAEEIV